MQYRGLFIGLTTIDIQYFVETFPVFNIKVKTKTPDILVGGPATNAAVAFAKLNNGAFLSTASGQNSFSGLIEMDFAKTKVNHFDIVKQQKQNPVIATVVTSKNGDRNIFTHNPEIIQPNIIAEELFKQVNPEIVLLDGFYPEFSLNCAQLARKEGIPVVLDCGSWKPQYDDLLEFTDIAICSNDFYPPKCNNPEQVFQFLQAKNIHQIAISKGGENILYFDKKRGEVAIEETKVADTLGAGDFLHGAFCYYFLQLNQFEPALKKASVIASYSCKFEGTRKWLNIDKSWIVFQK